MNIKMKREYQQIKEGTSTVWETYKTEERDIDKREHFNMVDAAPFFRRLGGSETLQREYTCRGYVVTRIISTRPDRLERRIFTFDFS